MLIYVAKIAVIYKYIKRTCRIMVENIWVKVWNGKYHN